MKKSFIDQTFVQECRSRLVQLKSELLNRILGLRRDFSLEDKSSGDEIDQTVAQQSENTFLITQERLRRQVMEIEFALGRIESGHFGFCEETDEPIEVERLRALPYTRLSIEGAEIRERLDRKFAKPS
jgi:DnaK suppressor protein